MKKTVILLAALIAAGPAASFAQEQPFVLAAPGTRFHTSGGNWHEIDSAQGALVRVVNNRFAVAEWIGLCETPSRDVQFNRAAADRLWPLTPGKSITYEKQRDERHWSSTIKVAGRERVTVPAGTFDAWIIEGEETGLSHTARALVRCWYAPEAGFVVKRQYRTLEGTGQNSSFEIVKIEKGDRSKVAAFRAPPAGTSFNTTKGGYRIDGATGASLYRSSDNPDAKVYWLAGLRDMVLNDRYFTRLQTQLDSVWPLEVGKVVRINADIPSNRPSEPTYVYQFEVSVTGTDTVTVPAGTFATYLVKWRERSVNQGFEALHTFWWSPALGFAVKKEVELVRGFGNYSGYELRGVTPAK